MTGNAGTYRNIFQKDSRLKLESVKFRKYANINLYKTQQHNETYL